MVHVTILFKSGSTISFKADDFTAKKEYITGKLSQIDWDCKNSNKYPGYINVDNVDAIIIKEIEEDNINE